MTGRKRDLLIYAFLDWLSALVSWFCFFVLRKIVENPAFSWDSVWNDPNLVLGLLLIPVWWIVVFYIFDSYRDIYRLSRMNTLMRTFALSLGGNLFLFFTLVSDDLSLHYLGNFTAFIALFGFHFILTALNRMIWLTRSSRRLKKGLVKYNTLIIGGSDPAREMYLNIQARPYQMGHRFVGFIN